MLITSLSFVEGEYNTTSHACCKGHRKEKYGKSWRCCGREIIDYNVEDCCAGKSFNKRNQQCCKGNYFGVKSSILVFTNHFNKTADSLSPLWNKHHGYFI